MEFHPATIRFMREGELSGASSASEQTPAMIERGPRRKLADLASSDFVRIAAIVLIFAWFPLQRARWTSVNDTDLWWHLRAGEWMVQHHQLPVTDPFSSTGAGKPWVAYSWPFEILLFEVARNWDLVGIVTYTIVTWMLMMLALFHLLRDLTPHFWRAALLVFLAGVVVERVTAARPGVFTILFFIIEFDILLRAQRIGNPRRLIPLPVLIWAWACVHVQFIYGLFVLGVFCVEPLLNRIFPYHAPTGEKRLSSVWLWSTLLASILLTFANPYGIGPYRVLATALRESRVFMMITETRPMPFDRPEHYIVLFLCLATAVVLGKQQRVRPLWLVFFLWSAVMTFRAERDIWVATMVAAMIIATGLPERGPATPVHRRVWLASAACVLLVLTWALKTGPTNQQLVSVVAHEMPMGAVAYIHEHHLTGPLFNDFDWGGYLIYALPEIPVVIDGRVNVHGLDELDRSMRTWNVWNHWDDDPLLKRANLVVAPPKYALTQVLSKDSHFKIVFDDGVSVLFQRVAAD